MIKIIKELPEDKKKQVIKELDNLGKTSSFGQYCKYSYEQLADIASMIEAYAYDEHGYKIVDSFLDQLNNVETDYLKAITNTTDKSKLKTLQAKIRGANKRTRIMVVSILKGRKKPKNDKLSLADTFTKLTGIFS